MGRHKSTDPRSQAQAPTTPCRSPSGKNSVFEASPHVGSVTAPHVSSPLIPKSTPSSSRKLKRKALEIDLVPARPQGHHIFTLDHKDVNLASLQHQSVFGVAAAWVRNDPCGEYNSGRASRSALAGFTLPEPSAEQHGPSPPKCPREHDHQASSVELRLDAVLNSLGMEQDTGTHPSTETLLADHRQQWKASMARKHATKNRRNSERYAASIEMIVSDQVNDATNSSNIQVPTKEVS